VPGSPGFAGAASAYMKAGGDRRFLVPLLRHFEDKPLVEIDQDAIDAAAEKLYPKASPATRNRQVYTPVSAILKRAGVVLELKRPRGAQGRQLTHWLRREQAFRIFGEADRIDDEFGILLRTLCYTGERLSTILALPIEKIEFEESLAYIGKTKNGDPRGVYLPPDLVKRMKRHPKGLKREGRFFTFTKSGHLYELLELACRRAKVMLPPRVAFHVFCHTWATWMRRYAGADLRGLVGTDRWKDIKSTFRYAHVVVSEDSRKAALLPVEGKRARR